MKDASFVFLVRLKRPNNSMVWTCRDHIGRDVNLFFKVFKIEAYL